MWTVFFFVHSILIAVWILNFHIYAYVGCLALANTNSQNTENTCCWALFDMYTLTNVEYLQIVVIRRVQSEIS